MDGSTPINFPYVKYLHGLLKVMSDVAPENQADEYLKMWHEISHGWDYSAFLSIWDLRIFPNFRHVLLLEKHIDGDLKGFVPKDWPIEVKTSKENKAHFTYPVERDENDVCSFLQLKNRHRTQGAISPLLLTTSRSLLP